MTLNQQIAMDNLDYYGRIVWCNSDKSYGFDNGGPRVHKGTIDSLIKKNKIRPLNDAAFGAKPQVYVAAH